MDRIYGQARKVNEERSQLYSKKRLVNTVKKKIQTTMIGAVAACEQYFGELWGHGKSPEELNEGEIFWRDRWEELRNEILNKGNTQLRAALEEISLYTLDFNKYRADFIVRKEQDGN